jgi:ribosomal small subunit protein bTHX
MGKGDKRTFRGKMFKGSYGKSRPQGVQKKKVAARAKAAAKAAAKAR